jgi:hypothetical protein
MENKWQYNTDALLIFYALLRLDDYNINMD